LQVRIYGLLLERMGFNCSKLKLALVRMRQESAVEDERKKELLNLITTALMKGHAKELEQAHAMKFFLYPHDSREAETSVLWAQDYWLKRREPIPTNNESKCRGCEYRDVCPFSLWKDCEIC